MRDLLGKCGTASMATKDTAVECADGLDFGALHANSGLANRHTGMIEGLVMVHQNNAALAAGDSFVPLIYDSADGTTYAEIARGKETAAAAPIYTRTRTQVPRTHRRWLKAAFMPKSSGSFTARVGEAWLELAPELGSEL